MSPDPQMSSASPEFWLATLREFACNRDDHTFARFVKESAPRLWSLFTALNIGRTPQDREELIQDLLFAAG